MPEQKTQPTDASVASYLRDLPDERKRADAVRLCEMLGRVTGQPAVMWGADMVGFGSYHYRYASGHEGDAPLAAFAARAKAFTLYLSCDIEQHRPLLDRLGKHKTGKGCLYVTRLSDVDEQVLEQLVTETVTGLKTA